jgi:TPR repeat protein
MAKEMTGKRCAAILTVAMFAAALLAMGQAVRAQQTGSLGAGIDAGLLVKANGGDAAAQVSVGESYQAGNGVPKDLQQASAWYQKAADKNNLSGELHLAALYRDGGKGFARDMAQAAVWFQKAADQGDVEAEATMGTLYSMGQGVQQNYAEAYYWLDLAAAVKGPKQAMYAAHRQMMGEHITADELDLVQQRAATWKAAHPRG